MVSDFTLESQSAAASTPAAASQCVSPASFWAPLHIVESAWHEHGPFAFWLTEAMQPRTFVELGTRAGFSYLAFCQGVQRLGLQTWCYAVDTWKGDDHAGFYGEEIFAALSATNERYYSGFSRLIRGLFDEALPYFRDGAIDLLHIDGQHGYEDVLHNFRTWRPKLSERAVVLFHDTNVRERGFEVWRLWEELAGEHPSFAFLHGHGLGVLALGRAIPEGLRALFSCGPKERAAIHNAYARLGTAVSKQYQLDLAHAHATVRDRDLERLRAEVTAAREAVQAMVAETERVQQHAAAASAAVAATVAEQARLEALATATGAALKAEPAATKTSQAAARAELAAAKADQAAARAERDALLHSTTWRATQPLRRVAQAMPAPARRAVRRLLRASYWLVTLQFGRRMAERRAARPDLPDPADGGEGAPAVDEYDRWVRECDR